MAQELAGTAELAFFGGARARSAPWLPASGAVCDWTAVMGGGWLDYLERLEAMLAPVGASMLARAAFRPGERVLDVGSGLGASAARWRKA